MYLSFGKHRGEEIENVPSDYLQWLMGALEDDDQFANKHPGLYEEVEDELDKRIRLDSHWYDR